MSTIHDTARDDRQRAIAEAGERSPFDRISNSFENWWEREGMALRGAGGRFSKDVARIAWLKGADAGIESVRPLILS